MILSALLLVVFVFSAPVLWRRLLIARHRDRALVAGELHLGRLGLPNGAVVGVRWTRYRPLSPTVGIPIVVPNAPIGAGAELGVADVLLTRDPRDPLETQRRVCHSDRRIS